MSAFDAVDGSSTGIAMCHIAVVIQERRMSPCGTKETFSDDSRNDCFGALSGSSDHQCLLLGVERTLTPVTSHDGF